MLHEALVAAEHLEREGFELCVVNMPWLNRVDTDWLADTVAPYSAIHVLEDHGPVAGLADSLARALMAAGRLGDRQVVTFAIDGYPACGTPPEALRFHGLDGATLASRILRDERAGMQATARP
jgi:transketolase